MQSCGTLDTGAAFPKALPKATPFLLRLASKLVLEVLPASLASMIGAMLLAHYHLTQPATLVGGTPAAAAAAPASASPTMVRLVRDEHDQIRDFLVAEQAAEKSDHAAADAQSAQAAAEARLAEAAAAAPRDATVATAEPPAVRVKTVAVAARLPAAPAARAGTASPAQPQGAPAPLAVAGLQDNAAPPAAPAHSALVATTLAMKDHVVNATSSTWSATWHAVTVIGAIPSWIGHRLGGNDADAGERQFSAAS